MDTASDAEVIARSHRDPGAFALVYDRHAAVVYRFLVRRIGGATADGLLGEVFRIAFERRGAFDATRPSARPWLYGIATRVLAKHRRAEARRLRATAELATTRSPRDDPADRVAASIDARDLWPKVAEAISGLPAGERDALLLFVWEELPYDEIAAALGVPVGTVRSRLNRARTRLRELTGGSGKEGVSHTAAAREKIEP
jgi:RNA polymerase sigma-70 factor (ECF subfamily)